MTVKMMTYVLLEARMREKALWKYAFKECGELCAAIIWHMSTTTTYLLKVTHGLT